MAAIMESPRARIKPRRTAGALFVNLRGRSGIPAITRAIDASFDSLIMLPSDMPWLGTEREPCVVRISPMEGTPETVIPVAATVHDFLALASALRGGASRDGARAPRERRGEYR